MSLLYFATESQCAKLSKEVIANAAACRLIHPQAGSTLKSLLATTVNASDDDMSACKQCVCADTMRAH